MQTGLKEHTVIALMDSCVRHRIATPNLLAALEGHPLGGVLTRDLGNFGMVSICEP